jgi:hypothetical protein
MPVFAALAGGKVALYRPLQAPGVGKVAKAGGKVAAASGTRWSYFTACWRIWHPNHKTHETTKKCSKKAKIHFLSA